MKKYLFITATALTLLACSETETETTSTISPTQKYKMEAYNAALKNAKYGWVMYIENPTRNTSTTDLEYKYNFEERIPDTKTDWTFFDKIYKDDMSRPEKQYLSFLILNIKDLIGVTKQDLSNKKNVDALKKYVNVLANEEYIGYTILFNALDVLKDTDSEFVKTQAAKIVAYAKNDSMSLNVINDKELQNHPEKPDHIDEMIANYGYVKQIEKLIF